MTSGQKVSLSLLISVLAFCAFTVVAFSGLFEILEVNFYQSVVQEVKEKKINDIAAEEKTYIDTLMERFDAFTKERSVKSYVETRASSQNAKDRSLKYAQLKTSTVALLGLRIVDINGRNIHFSSFPSDQKSSKKGIAYKNYPDLNEIPYKYVKSSLSVQIDDEFSKKGHLIKDGKGNRLVFSLPYYNGGDKLVGTALFYCDAGHFGQFLFNRGLIEVKGFPLLLTQEVDKSGKAYGFGGFVFGMPNMGKELKEKILDFWANSPEEKMGRFVLENQLPSEENPKTEEEPKTQEGENSQKDSSSSSLTTLCAFSSLNSNPELGYITMLYDESELKFPPYIRILILITAFITFYLAVLLILSFKHDDIVIIRDKVRRYQSEFFITCKKNGQLADKNYLAEQKDRVENQCLKSLGKKGLKHSSEFKSIFESGWQEMLISFGEKLPALAMSGQSPVQASINAEELKEIVRSSLEDILENGKVRIKTENLISSPRESSPSRKSEVPPAKEAKNVEELDEVEEIPEAEELEEAQSAEELEDVEEIPEAEEVEEAESAEELDEVEEIPEAEEVEEAESVEELDEVEEIPEAEEVEEAQSAEELEDVEEIPEAEEVEEAQSVEELDEVEEIPEAEEAEEAESAEELDEVEEIPEAEEVEEAQSVEELEDVEEIPEAEEVSDAEEIAKIADIREDLKIDDTDEIRAVEGVEKAADFKTFDSKTRLHELEEEVGELEQLSEKENTLAALPEEAPKWEDNDSLGLDDRGLSRALTYSEQHDIEKLKEVASKIDEVDSNLDELEVYDQDGSEPINDISDEEEDNNKEDDVYSDELLLEKIDFGVPTTDIFDTGIENEQIENFTALPPDYSYLDINTDDDEMYRTDLESDITDNEHYYENPALIHSLEKESENLIESQKNADNEDGILKSQGQAEKIEQIPESKAEEYSPAEELSSVEEAEEMPAEEYSPAEETSPLEEAEEIPAEEDSPAEELSPLEEAEEMPAEEDSPAEELSSLDRREESSKIEELEEFDSTDELETLEEPEESMPFMFTKIGASNGEISELMPDLPDSIIEDEDGTFHVTDLNAGAEINLNQDFKKLVDSILR